MLAAFVSVLGVLVLLDTVAWHFLFLRGIGRKAPPSAPLEHFPSITMTRPIRGLDVGQAENLRAALDTGYPGGIETLLVFDDESDVGLPGARAAVAEHVAMGRPGSVRVLIVGPPPPGRTGKLNAMILASRRARGELVAFGDSDTRPRRGLLQSLVETLMAHRLNGSVFAPAVVTSKSRSAGDVGYAMMLNGLYGPAVARAAKFNDSNLPFIMGQIMVFRREALASVGGVECATGQLVDDMHIGKCLHETGWRNVMIKEQLSIAAGGLTVKEFLAVYRRWMLFSRGGLPFAFTWPLWLRGVEFYVAVSLVPAAFAVGSPIAALAPALALLAQGLSVADLQRRFGGARVPVRHAWMLWCLFVAVLLVVGSMFRRGVEWRGRSYSLGSGGELEESESSTGIAPAE